MKRYSILIWKNLIKNQWSAKELFIVEHSAGGACVHEIITNYQENMISKIKAIELTIHFMENIIKI